MLCVGGSVVLYGSHNVGTDVAGRWRRMRTPGIIFDVAVAVFILGPYCLLGS